MIGSIPKLTAYFFNSALDNDYDYVYYGFPVDDELLHVSETNSIATNSIVIRKNFPETWLWKEIANIRLIFYLVPILKSIRISRMNLRSFNELKHTQCWILVIWYEFMLSIRIISFLARGEPTLYALNPFWYFICICSVSDALKVLLPRLEYEKNTDITSHCKL